MDKKSKILIWVFVGLTVLSVGYTFYKTVILQDFVVIDSSEEEVDETQIIDSAVETGAESFGNEDVNQEESI